MFISEFYKMFEFLFELMKVHDARDQNRREWLATLDRVRKEIQKKAKKKGA